MAVPLALITSIVICTIEKWRVPLILNKDTDFQISKQLTLNHFHKAHKSIQYQRNELEVKFPFLDSNFICFHLSYFWLLQMISIANIVPSYLISLIHHNCFVESDQHVLFYWNIEYISYNFPPQNHLVFSLA